MHRSALRRSAPTATERIFGQGNCGSARFSLSLPHDRSKRIPHRSIEPVRRVLALQRRNDGRAVRRPPKSDRSHVGKPEDYPRDRTIVLETAPCQRLRLFVYLIPHTLPAGNTVADSRPFELQVAIRCGGRPLRTERFAVNQWSGASLELQLEAQPPQRPAAE